MERVILERVQVKVDNFQIASDDEIVVADPDEKNAILNRCRDVDFIFRRIVAQLQLPIYESQAYGKKVKFQQGSTIAKICPKTSTAVVEFFVHEDDQCDLMYTIKQRYDERKAFEFEQMRMAAEIARQFDVDELDEEEMRKLTEAFREIIEKSCVVKKFSDVNQIAQLGVRIDGDDEPIFDDLVKTRLKQVIDNFSFDYLQPRFEAHVKGVLSDAAEVVICDNQRAELKIFIPTTFLNECYKARFMAHHLALKPFQVRFEDPESLKLSKSSKKKIPPKAVEQLMGVAECEEVFCAHVRGDHGQAKLELVI